LRFVRAASSSASADWFARYTVSTAQPTTTSSTAAVAGCLSLVASPLLPVSRDPYRKVTQHGEQHPFTRRSNVMRPPLRFDVRPAGRRRAAPPAPDAAAEADGAGAAIAFVSGAA